MRIGLLSDSHGQALRTRDAVRLLVDRGAEMLLHLGDIETQAVIDELAGQDSRLVFGNNDDERTLGRYASSLGLCVMHPLGRLEVDARTIAFTHGHIARCMREAEGADYLLHGHTHRRRDERIGASRWINPGALHRAHPYSVAILDPSNDLLEFIELMR